MRGKSPLLAAERMLAFALAGLLSLSHETAAQNLVVPPNVTPPPGSDYQTVTVNPGGFLSADGLTIHPGGGQTGLAVQAPGSPTATAILTNTTIDLGAGGGERGITADGLGASVTFGAGSSVLSSGGGGNYGVLITNGARVNFVDGAFINMVGGGGSSEVQVSGNGFFDMTGGSLTVSGGGGNGIRAGDDSTPGSIRFNGTEIIVLGSGGNSVGVWANITGSTAELIDTNITVSGPGGGNFGVKATQGADVSMTGGSILVDATGGNNIGVQVQGAGSTASIVNASVTVTNSDASIAAQVDGAGASLTSVNSDFLVTGANGTGLQLTNGGTADMSGGSIKTTGAGGQAILVSGFGQNNGTFDGVEVHSVNGTGIVARDSMSSNLDFSNGSSVIGGNGTLLLNQTNNAASVVNLSGDNDVVFIGDVDARGGEGTTNVTLERNTTLTGAINVNDLTGAAGTEPAQPVTGLPRMNVNLDIDSTSVWNMRTSSTVNTLNVSPGARIIFPQTAAGTPFRTLALERLTGTGGIFTMQVDLGEIRGDLIHIGTSGRGAHSLDLTNRDPVSDLPVNTALLVVRTPDQGSSYSGGVEGGVFRYTVVRGNGSSVLPRTTDWYLVRLDQAPGTVDPDPGPDPDPDPGTNGDRDPDPDPDPGTDGDRDPDPDPDPDPSGPDIPMVDALTNPANAAIGTYAATFTIFHAGLYNIEDRLAELRTPSQRPEPFIPTKGDSKKGIQHVNAPPPSPATGFWIRTYASEIDFKTGQSREFEQILGGGEIGFDRRIDVPSGELYLGIFGGYVYAERDFFDGGEGTSEGYNVGLYADWNHPSGWFIDAIVKHTYLQNDFSTRTDSRRPVEADYSVPVFGGMVEIGRRWDIGDVFIEPYGSLGGGWAPDEDYTMSHGLKVHAGDQASLRGRLGMRMGLHWEYANGRILEPYVRVGVMNEFLEDDGVVMNQFEFVPHYRGAVLEASAGINARVNRSFFLYAEYTYSNGDKIRSPWAGNLGVRWEW